MSFTSAWRELGSHQKTAKSAPPYSRFANRPLGRILAAAAFGVGLNPTQVTLISALCTASGIATIASVEPSVLSTFVAVVLLVLGYALDSADGQLARLLNGGTPGGEWLDHTIDAAKIPSLHLAVLVSLFRFGDLSNENWLLVPIGFTITSSVLFFSFILRDHMLKGFPASTNRRADGERHSVWGSIGRALEDYGILMLSILLLPSTDGFIVVYTVLFTWSLLMVAIALPRRFNAVNNPGHQKVPT